MDTEMLMFINSAYLPITGGLVCILGLFPLSTSLVLYPRVARETVFAFQKPSSEAENGQEVAQSVCPSSAESIFVLCMHHLPVLLFLCCSTAISTEHSWWRVALLNSQRNSEDKMWLALTFSPTLLWPKPLYCNTRRLWREKRALSALCVSEEWFGVDELRLGRDCQMRWWWWLKRLGLSECFLAEEQHRRYHVFDHSTLDRLPSVCDEIELLLYFAFNFTFAYSISFLFYKLCCILLSLYKQVKLLSFWTKFEAVLCCFFALCSKLRAE